MEKPDHQGIKVRRATIVAIYVMLCTGFILLFPSADTVGWLSEEDGPIENAGALSYLLAGTVFFVTAHRSSGIHRSWDTTHIGSPLALLALGALCLVCFAEEISWGQRLFHYPVPAWLEDVNRQGEWNLHNLAWFHAETAEGVLKSFWERLINLDRLLALFQLSLCTLVPMLTAYSTTFRTWGARIGFPIVPWWITGLVPAHFLITQVLYAISPHNSLLERSVHEWKETVRACIFLVVAAWAYYRTTARHSVSAGARPYDAVVP